MEVEPWKRVVEDLDFECAETATYLTYRDIKAVIENPYEGKAFQTPNTLMRPEDRSLH